MTLDEYKQFVKESAYGNALVEPTKTYFALGFGGEAGEVLNEVKKEIRDGGDRRENVCDELGDALWYWTALAGTYHLTIEEILDYNVAKLKARRAARKE